MTCTYYDLVGDIILEEQIPQKINKLAVLAL
jgi:hypothetical protein